MPQTPEQEVLVRTLMRDSKALAQNQPIQPEQVLVHPERDIDSPQVSGSPRQKGNRTTILLLIVFLVLGGILTYLLMNPELL